MVVSVGECSRVYAVDGARGGVDAVVVGGGEGGEGRDWRRQGSVACCSGHQHLLSYSAIRTVSALMFVQQLRRRPRLVRTEGASAYQGVVPASAGDGADVVGTGQGYDVGGHVHLSGRGRGL